MGTYVGLDGSAVGTYVGSEGVTVGVTVGHGDTAQWLPVVVVPLTTSPQLFDRRRYDFCTENSAVIELGTEPVR